MSLHAHLSVLLQNVHTLQHKRSFLEASANRLEQNIFDKYQNIAHLKKYLQYYNSWLDNVNTPIASSLAMLNNNAILSSITTPVSATTTTTTTTTTITATTDITTTTNTNINTNANINNTTTATTPLVTIPQPAFFSVVDCYTPSNGSLNIKLLNDPKNDNMCQFIYYLKAPEILLTILRNFVHLKEHDHKQPNNSELIYSSSTIQPMLLKTFYYSLFPCMDELLNYVVKPMLRELWQEQGLSIGGSSGSGSSNSASIMASSTPTPISSNKEHLLSFPSTPVSGSSSSSSSSSASSSFAINKILELLLKNPSLYTPQELTFPKLSLVLLYEMMHYRLANQDMPHMFKIVNKLSQGDMLFITKKPLELYEFVLECIHDMFAGDFSSNLDILYFIYHHTLSNPSQHVSTSTRTNASGTDHENNQRKNKNLQIAAQKKHREDMMKLILVIILEWLIFPIMHKPWMYGYCVSYTCEWQQVSSGLLISILRDEVLRYGLFSSSSSSNASKNKIDDEDNDDGDEEEENAESDINWGKNHKKPGHKRERTRKMSVHYEKYYQNKESTLQQYELPPDLIQNLWQVMKIYGEQFVDKIVQYEKQRSAEVMNRAAKSNAEAADSGIGTGGVGSMGGGSGNSKSGAAVIPHTKEESTTMSVLRQWSLISSMELEVLHSLLFVNLVGLSNRMIRDLHKFKNMSFDTLDTKTVVSIPTTVAANTDPLSAIRRVMERIMTGSYRNPYLFVAGPISSKSMHALWGIKISEECVGEDCKAHLNSICRKNVEFILKVQPHIQKAPDLFNTWCQSMIELLLHNEPFSSLQLTGARNGRSDIDSMYSTFENLEAKRDSIMTPRESLLLGSVSKENASTLPSPSIPGASPRSTVALDHVHAYDDFGEVMQYLNQREVEGPSLLSGIGKSKLTQQCHIAQVVFGLKELHQVYPKLAIPLNNIIQWFSICVAQAHKQLQNWYQSTINALDETLCRLSVVETAYQRKITYAKSCLFASKLHMFVVNEEIPFHLSINVKDSESTKPNLTKQESSAMEISPMTSSKNETTTITSNVKNIKKAPMALPQSKILMDFFCDSIPDFIDKVLGLYPKLYPNSIPGREEKDEKQRLRVMCVLINKFIEKISVHLKAHFSSEEIDYNLLRGIHDVISTALFYLLNAHLWKKDAELFQILQSLESQTDPHKDFGLNKELNLDHDMWDWVGRHLETLEYHSSPATKMQCLHETIQLLSQHLSFYLQWKQQLNKKKKNIERISKPKTANDDLEDTLVSADDLFPALLHVIVKTKPKFLASSLALIEGVSEPPSSGSHAYSYTLFQQAMFYINQMSKTDVKNT